MSVLAVSAERPKAIPVCACDKRVVRGSTSGGGVCEEKVRATERRNF